MTTVEPINFFSHREDQQRLQEKANEKEKTIRTLIQVLDMAIKLNGPAEQSYLKRTVNADNRTFLTLVEILVAEKYEMFIRLRCVVLRAMQIMLRVAAQLARDGGKVKGPDVGMLLFSELCRGNELAKKAYQHVVRAVLEKEEHEITTVALLLLAELGEEALEPKIITQRLLELCVECPDRLGELVVVALKIHSFGGTIRSNFVEVVMQHPGGRHLGEVLVQVINMMDDNLKLPAIKVITSCLKSPGGHGFLYTNDAQVLADVLLREMTERACEDAREFHHYAACLKALYMTVPNMRDYRREQTHQALLHLRDTVGHGNLPDPFGLYTEINQVIGALVGGANGHTLLDAAN